MKPALRLNPFLPPPQVPSLLLRTHLSNEQEGWRGYAEPQIVLCWNLILLKGQHLCCIYLVALS